MATYTLITGASSGIGYELAKICAENNQNLVLVARRSEKLEEIKSQFEKKYKIKVYILTKDLSLSASPQEIYNELKKQKINIDILINNAGFGNHGLFQDTDINNSFNMIQVNIAALISLTRLFIPDMLKNKNGKILNLASTASFFPGPYMAIYYATKAFVLSFSEALATELAGTGITVTTLCPGPTNSEFSKIANTQNTRLFNKQKIPTAQQVAEYGFKQMMNGKRIAIHGLKNKLMIQFARLLPLSIVTKAVKIIQK